MAIVLGVWQRQQKKHKELRELYDSKLIMVEKMLAQWVQEHPDAHLPVTFDSWFTQPDFCRYLDQELHLAYVGTLSWHRSGELSKNGEIPLDHFAQQLKQEHLAALLTAESPLPPHYHPLQRAAGNLLQLLPYPPYSWFQTTSPGDQLSPG